MNTSNLIRLPSVKAKSGCARSTIYQRVSEGLFTKPVRLGARSVAWPESEVLEINAARIAGKSDEEIRALVTKLEAARKAAA